MYFFEHRGRELWYVCAHHPSCADFIQNSVDATDPSYGLSRMINHSVNGMRDMQHDRAHSTTSRSQIRLQLCFIHIAQHQDNNAHSNNKQQTLQHYSCSAGVVVQIGVLIIWCRKPGYSESYCTRNTAAGVGSKS